MKKYIAYYNRGTILITTNLSFIEKDKSVLLYSCLDDNEFKPLAFDEKEMVWKPTQYINISYDDIKKDGLLYPKINIQNIPQFIIKEGKYKLIVDKVVYDTFQVLGYDYMENVISYLKFIL